MGVIMKNLTKCVITLFACLSLIGLYGDENGFKNRMSSAFDEVSLASLPIIVVDAVNGAPVIDAEVKIGSSPVMTTNADGKVFFKADQDGTYDVEIKKHGYIRMLSTVEMQAGSIFGNANVFAVSKLLPLDHIRIVLEWGDKPRDLDLHLIKKESCHISYRNKRTSRDRRIKLD